MGANPFAARSEEDEDDAFSLPTGLQASLPGSRLETTAMDKVRGPTGAPEERESRSKFFDDGCIIQISSMQIDPFSSNSPLQNHLRQQYAVIPVRDFADPMLYPSFAVSLEAPDEEDDSVLLAELREKMQDASEFLAESHELPSPPKGWCYLSAPDAPRDGVDAIVHIYVGEQGEALTGGGGDKEMLFVACP